MPVNTKSIEKVQQNELVLCIKQGLQAAVNPTRLKYKGRLYRKVTADQSGLSFAVENVFKSTGWKNAMLKLVQTSKFSGMDQEGLRRFIQLAAQDPTAKAIDETWQQMEQYGKWKKDVEAYLPKLDQHGDKLVNEFINSALPAMIEQAKQAPANEPASTDDQYSLDKVPKDIQETIKQMASRGNRKPGTKEYEDMVKHLVKDYLNPRAASVSPPATIWYKKTRYVKAS